MKRSYLVYIELAICLLSINILFSIWGILQEDLTTKTIRMNDGSSEKYSGYLFLNGSQSLCCILLGLVALCIQNATQNYGKAALKSPVSMLKFQETIRNPRVMWYLCMLGMTQSIGPTFGMFAAEFVSFPTVLVGKTIKMVPVMIVGYFIHGVRYRPKKYVVAFLITVGVTVFSMFTIRAPRLMHAKEHAMSDDDVTGSADLLEVSLRSFGFLLLFIDLFSSAYTASTQEEVVKRTSFTGLQLLVWSNTFALIWHCVFTTLSEYADVLSPILPIALSSLLQQYVTPQFTPSMDMVWRSREFTQKVALYTICGGAGQMVLYYILARFGSVTLTASTVTRKVFGIFLSITWNKHTLQVAQWFALIPILLGVCIDFSLHGGSSKKKENAIETAGTASDTSRSHTRSKT